MRSGRGRVGSEGLRRSEEGSNPKSAKISGIPRQRQKLVLRIWKIVEGFSGRVRRYFVELGDPSTTWSY